MVNIPHPFDHHHQQVPPDQNRSQKQKSQTSSDDTSLLSFERHELSAGNATLMTINDQDEIKSMENYSPPAHLFSLSSSDNECRLVLFCYSE